MKAEELLSSEGHSHKIPLAGNICSHIPHMGAHKGELGILFYLLVLYCDFIILSMFLSES